MMGFLPIISTRNSSGNSWCLLSDGWTDGMGNAWIGAMTDGMHNGWMDGMDNAQTGAATDEPYNVQMDGMDDAWTGAMTDVPYDEWMDGDFTGISCR